MRSNPPASARVSFAEVDHQAGAIRARGHLTEQGADLIRGAVLVLHGRGHARVTLDLGGVQGADDAGLRALRTLQAAVTADGGELVLVHAPRGAAAVAVTARVPARC